MPVHTTLDPIEATTRAVDALLAAIDRAPSAGAAIAYRGAIARHGRNLLATAGDAGLEQVFVRIQSDAPDSHAAAERERIVREIWEGIA